MAQTTYQVILSTDGKHTVIVTSEDQASVRAAESWAKTTYEMIVERYGLKGAVKPVSPGGNQAEDEIPVCEVHGVLMALVNGRKGPFWSCHEKNPDGSWCSYRPDGR